MLNRNCYFNLKLLFKYYRILKYNLEDMAKLVYFLNKWIHILWLYISINTQIIQQIININYVILKLEFIELYIFSNFNSNYLFEIWSPATCYKCQYLSKVILSYTAITPLASYPGKLYLISRISSNTHKFNWLKKL